MALQLGSTSFGFGRGCQAFQRAGLKISTPLSHLNLKSFWIALPWVVACPRVFGESTVLLVTQGMFHLSPIATGNCHISCIFIWELFAFYSYLILKTKYTTGVLALSILEGLAGGEIYGWSLSSFNILWPGTTALAMPRCKLYSHSGSLEGLF